jgi:hypothetical protein
VSSVFTWGGGQLVSAECSWSVDRATALRACVAGHRWDLERESERKRERERERGRDSRLPSLTGAASSDSGAAPTPTPRVWRARGGQTSWWHSGLAAARREGPEATVDAVNHVHVYLASCSFFAGQLTISSFRSCAGELTTMCI